MAYYLDMNGNYFRTNRDTWERQYLNGQWDFIRQPDELAHYALLIGYHDFFNHGGAILDVGCGEGILHERFSPGQFERYLGIDISAEAIRRASLRAGSQAVFVRADATRYETHEKFDTLVFNECLYYFKNPLIVLNRYVQFMNEDGIILISMHDTEIAVNIWRQLEVRYLVRDEVRISNKAGTAWHVKVLTTGK